MMGTYVLVRTRISPPGAPVGRHRTGTRRQGRCARLLSRSLQTSTWTQTGSWLARTRRCTQTRSKCQTHPSTAACTGPATATHKGTVVIKEPCTQRTAHSALPHLEAHLKDFANISTGQLALVPHQVRRKKEQERGVACHDVHWECQTCAAQPYSHTPKTHQRRRT